MSANAGDLRSGVRRGLHPPGIGADSRTAVNAPFLFALLLAIAILTVPQTKIDARGIIRKKNLHGNDLDRALANLVAEAEVAERKP